MNQPGRSEAVRIRTQIKVRVLALLSVLGSSPLMVAGLLRRRLLSPQTLPKRPGRVYSRSLASVTKPGAYGQPLFHSHPHLSRIHIQLASCNAKYSPHYLFAPVKQHDLTPGIKADEYEQRRKRLMDSLPKNSLVVSVAAPIKMMSNSTCNPRCLLCSLPDLLVSCQIYCELYP